MHSEFVALEAARFVLREYNSTMGTNRGYFLFIFFLSQNRLREGAKKRTHVDVAGGGQTQQTLPDASETADGYRWRPAHLLWSFDFGRRRFLGRGGHAATRVFRHRLGRVPQSFG